MIQKVTAYIKNNHIVLYLALGVVTTAVNFAVYFPLYNICSISASISNGISWLASVVVAFLTNKPLVFKSGDWSVKTVFQEFVKFTGCRLASGLIETAVIYVTVDLLLLNGNVLKILISIFVVIFNYFASKYLVFKHK